MTSTRLALTRAQILAFRQQAGGLCERSPRGPGALRRAAWAGLQDSMPRAALLSIHARVAGTQPSDWEHPSLVQVWGPRFSVFVVAAEDVAVFTAALMPDGARGRQRAEELAAWLAEFLGGRKASANEAGRAHGSHPNTFRYAAATGTVLVRWDGARRPDIWTVPRPEMSPAAARLELARRYLHVYGPATGEVFGQWAGSAVGPRGGEAAFAALGDELVPVRTPAGGAWILAADEDGFVAAGGSGAPSPAAARLLPSGDPYWLYYEAAGRELVLPGPAQRDELWTSRVWPGALLVGGEITGTWRRADTVLTVRPWRALTAAERDAVTAEAESLPLPGAQGAITVRWDG